MRHRQVRFTKQSGKVFELRIIKQSLGKVVPIAGIVLGFAFNWTTLEPIVDAADVAYRRRFLLEKYPNLETGETPIAVPDTDDTIDDETLSVVDEIINAGGPDLRNQ